MTYTTDDLAVGFDLFVHGIWEAHLVRLLPYLHLAGKVAIDVGANVGTYTMRLSDAVGPTGSVIAMEPDPQTCAWLRQNVRQNNCANVSVVQAAAGSEPTVAAFANDLVNRGNHRIVGEGEPHDRTVEVVTVDSLTQSLPENTVGFIKIDVQGFELEVVRGMLDTLRRNPGCIIQLELNAKYDGLASALVALLGEVGWNGFEILPKRLIPMQTPTSYEWPLFTPLLWSDCDLLLSSDVDGLRAMLDVAMGEILNVRSTSGGGQAGR